MNTLQGHVLHLRKNVARKYRVTSHNLVAGEDTHPVKGRDSLRATEIMEDAATETTDIVETTEAITEDGRVILYNQGWNKFNIQESGALPDGSPTFFHFHTIHLSI